MLASQQLCFSHLQMLATGKLLPHSESVGGGGENGLAGLLGCLAAAPSGPRLLALISQALGVNWGPVGEEHLDQGGDEEEEEEEDQNDEMACRTCHRGWPSKNLLLCDGCDAAYHTTCLKPPLSSIPQGDWFCSACCSSIRRSVLSRENAVVCMQLLEETSAGRALLSSSQFATNTTTLLAESAHEALAAAAKQLGPGSSMAGVTGQLGQRMERAAESCQQAVGALAVYAKVSSLLLSCGLAGDGGGDELDLTDVSNQCLGKIMCTLNEADTLHARSTSAQCPGHKYRMPFLSHLHVCGCCSGAPSSKCGSRRKSAGLIGFRWWPLQTELHKPPLLADDQIHMAKPRLHNK